MQTVALRAPERREEQVEPRGAEPAHEVLPGFERDPHGKPLIGLDEGQLYAYGHLIRSAEQLILDLFSRGLLSGTTLAGKRIAKLLPHRETCMAISFGYTLTMYI